MPPRSLMQLYLPLFALLHLPRVETYRLKRLSHQHERSSLDAHVIFTSIPSLSTDGWKLFFKRYTVAEPAANPTLRNSVFSVPILIDDTSPPLDLVYQFEPGFIPRGATAALAVSSELCVAIFACRRSFPRFSQTCRCNYVEHLCCDDNFRSGGGTMNLSLHFRRGNAICIRKRNAGGLFFVLWPSRRAALMLWS